MRAHQCRGSARYSSKSWPSAQLNPSPAASVCRHVKILHDAACARYHCDLPHDRYCTPHFSIYQPRLRWPNQHDHNHDSSTPHARSESKQARLGGNLRSPDQFSYEIADREEQCDLPRIRIATKSVIGPMDSRPTGRGNRPGHRSHGHAIPTGRALTKSAHLMSPQSLLVR